MHAYVCDYYIKITTNYKNLAFINYYISDNISKRATNQKINKVHKNSIMAVIPGQTFTIVSHTKNPYDINHHYNVLYGSISDITIIMTISTDYYLLAYEGHISSPKGSVDL